MANPACGRRFCCDASGASSPAILGLSVSRRSIAKRAPIARAKCLIIVGLLGAEGARGLEDGRPGWHLDRGRGPHS